MIVHAATFCSFIYGFDVLKPCNNTTRKAGNNVSPSEEY